MKNLLYILLIFLALPFAGLAQKDSIIVTEKEQPSFKNQIDLDVELLGASFGYNRKIFKKWFFGFTMGLGYLVQPVYEKGLKTSINDYYIAFELAHIGVVIKYFKTNKLCFEINPRLSIGSRIEGITPFYGIGAGVYYGKSIQIGLKIKVSYPFEVVYSGDSRLFLSTSLIILRIPFRVVIN